MFKTASLPKEILYILLDKGTEHPFTGEYDEFDQAGSYLCRRCGLALFRSQTKFHSGCGWPSFDEEITNAVIRQADADGKRTEILCARCKSHLGHVFHGEGHTLKNTRHCVNSLSLDFVPDQKVIDTEEAIFAAGCFWGVEYLYKQLPGVLKAEVGYSGGHKDHPSYQEVCRGDTGHFEVVRVVYDMQQLSYENIVKYFFEIHDPTQGDGQGPDRGEQYLSRIFYYNEAQRKIAQRLIAYLEKTGLNIATQLQPVSIFWPADASHQHYYEKTSKEPYCHRYEKRKWD